MNPVFFHDPFWLTVVKILLLFVALLVWTIFNVWYERRLLGKMQNRIGPVMNGPLGLGQALGDGAKLIFKEDYRPANTDAFIFNLAPILAGFASFTGWAVIPFAGEVNMFGVETRLQLTDLPVAALFVMAIASIGIYGVVLAGWASSNSYSFLGSIRSAAQMISYELAMGLAIVGVLMRSGSMSTWEIVEAQNQPIPFAIPFTNQLFMGGDHHITGWYFFLLFPCFVVYVISMVGETNRAPFDLPECESELVSGFMTDYSGFRYAMFFLAEYINMLTVSAMCVTLFLGGYLMPWPFNLIPGMTDPGWWGVLAFVVKVQLVFSFFMWLRGATWRFRYDQFMNLGWKYLIEIVLVYLVLVMLFPQASALTGVLVAIAGFFILASKRREDLEPVEEPEPAQPEVFDPFAGGYPVPPRKGQVLPEMAGVVAGGTTDDEDHAETETTGRDA